VYSSQCNCYFTILSKDKTVLRIHFKYKCNLERKNFVWQSPENLFIIPSGLPGKKCTQWSGKLYSTNCLTRVHWTQISHEMYGYRNCDEQYGATDMVIPFVFLTSVGNLFPFWRSVLISTTPLTLNTIWFCVLSHENARKNHPINSFYIFKQRATLLYFTTCCVISVLFFHKMPFVS